MNLLTEIERMLCALRRVDRPTINAHLPEGPRVGGVCSTYAEECGSHNLLQCSEYHCAVQRIEHVAGFGRFLSSGGS